MFRHIPIVRCLRLAFGGGVAGIALFAMAAHAQDVQTTDKVEITGSLIKRVANEGSLPVTTVTRKDIERSGVTSTEQLMNSLTSTSFVGATTASEGAGLSTYGEATVSLRGLGANRTLVLVNGRRIANYATDGTAVDVNSIPLSAIDRVEVLRDGASGVYGSDAVAGVINFILRSNFNGLEGSASVGTPTSSGGGRQTKLGLVFGKGDLEKDRYNFMISGDYAKETALYGRDRSYANHAWDNGGAFDLSATPSGALKGPWDPALGNLYENQALSTIGHPLSPNNCAQNGSAFDANLGTCRFNPSPYVPLVPDIERYNLAGAAHFKINNDMTLYAEGFVSRTKTVTTEQPSPISATFLATDGAFAGSGVAQSLLLTPGNANYPAAFITANGGDATKPVSVSYRVFDGGNRVHTDIADQTHLVGGIQGVFKDWDYDISLNTNTSKVTESTNGGYESQLALVKYLNGNPNWNPNVQFQDAATAAGIQATVFNGKMISSKLTANNLDAKASGELYQLPAGPLTAAVGLNFRQEKLDYEPTAAYISGDVSGYGGQQKPYSTSRNANAVFAEINAPILKGLSADLAVRNDRYPGLESTNPKASVRWVPVKSVLVRGSWGTGFRAPALPELYLPATVGTTNTFTDPVTGTKGQFTQFTGGFAGLKPEKSEQSSFGLVLDPAENLTMSFDYYKIRIRDTITSLDPQFVVQQAAAGNGTYIPLVKRDAAGNILRIDALNGNAGTTRTSGIDVDIKWRVAKTSYGTVTAELNGSYTQSYDVVLPDGTVQHSVARTVDDSGNLLSTASALGGGGGVIMRWRHALTVGLTNPDWYGSVTQNFQTGYSDNTDANGNLPPPRIGAFSTWDMQGGYTAIKNMKIAVGLKNVFNRQPPQAATAGNYFQTGYDPTYYDPRGRFLYTTLSYKFQ